MPAPKCSDAAFIATWKELQSATLVAKHLGCSVRAAQQRRQRIQDVHRISLPTTSIAPQGAHYNTTLIEANRAVVKLQVQDGTVLVGSDVHIWPGERTTMQRAFVQMAAKLKPYAVIANGDVFDGARISRFDHASWLDMEKKPSVKAELDAVGDWLGDVEKAAPGAKKLWPMGNHDARFERRLVTVNPEYAGVHGTRLKDHFPAWTPCWRVDINDDVVVRHRELGGEHADFRNVVTQGKTIVTGHDHRTGVVPYRNYCGLHWGVRCGYLADSPQDPQFVDYLEGRTPNWHPAFAVLTFVKGRLLMPELCVKHDDNHVEFRGEIVPV